MAPTNKRLDPSTVGVIIPPQDKIKVYDHAFNRLAQQTRFFCLLYLLRCKDIVPNEEVTVATTKYQDGQAGPGHQAAHWLIASLAVGGRDLETILATRGGGTGSRIHQLLITILSQTTNLRTIYNQADGCLEDNGLRNKVVEIATGIVSETYDPKDPMHNYRARIFNAYQIMRTYYIQQCMDQRLQSLIDSQKYLDKYDKQMKVNTSKFKPEALQDFKNKVRIGIKHADDGIMMPLVLQIYQKVATNTSFPLSDGEMGEIRQAVEAIS